MIPIRIEQDRREEFSELNSTNILMAMNAGDLDQGKLYSLLQAGHGFELTEKVQRCKDMTVISYAAMTILIGFAIIVHIIWYFSGLYQRRKKRQESCEDMKKEKTGRTWLNLLLDLVILLLCLVIPIFGLCGLLPLTLGFLIAAIVFGVILLIWNAWWFWANRTWIKPRNFAKFTLFMTFVFLTILMVPGGHWINLDG